MKEGKEREKVNQNERRSSPTKPIKDEPNPA